MINLDCIHLGHHKDFVRKAITSTELNAEVMGRQSLPFTLVTVREYVEVVEWHVCSDVFQFIAWYTLCPCVMCAMSLMILPHWCTLHFLLRTYILLLVLANTISLVIGHVVSTLTFSCIEIGSLSYFMIRYLSPTRANLILFTLIPDFKPWYELNFLRAIIKARWVVSLSRVGMKW